MVTINYECVAATLTLTWVLEHFRWSYVAWVRRKDLRNQSCVAKTVYVVGRVVAYDPLFQSCSDSLGKFNGWNSESIHRAFQAHCAKSQQFCVHVQRFLRCFEGPKRSLRNGQCSSAPHSQAAERAIPHLCKQERKRPAPVQRQLCWAHANGHQQKFFQRASFDILLILFWLLTMQCKLTFTKHFCTF